MRPARRQRPDEIGVMLEAPQWRAALPEAAALVERAAAAALRRAASGGGACAVLLADDATVQALNRRFRNQDKPTNVLAFPMRDAADAAPTLPGDPPQHHGDVALAYETVAREAGEQGKPLAHHLAHLVVHGVLHLLGHDHQSAGETAAMEALEIEILRGLGIADPYAAELQAGAATP